MQLGLVAISGKTDELFVKHAKKLIEDTVDFQRSYAVLLGFIPNALYKRMFKAAADGLVGPVLAGPTFIHGKNKILGK